ncbi:hypothetical protein Nepgr_023499 [Nepenthes gracilis]|uniref:PHD-type zinc finger plants domain-containing protein n=1 Tax=Nepenthes gracilis TaxID=150966 RepID=A0AAD3XXS2_NEPGR|nr:hypothetical protein Nepgr_023499 [Nepenthes gracilis]
MEDNQTVCCMCGDVGFQDKLFNCTRCRYRFQHSYCSNYYNESSEGVAGVCNWCQSEERSTASKPGGHSKKSTAACRGVFRPECAGERIKHDDRAEEGGGSGSGSSGEKGRNPSSGAGVPSPRPSTRRYKLLKDVMC